MSTRHWWIAVLATLLLAGIALVLRATLTDSVAGPDLGDTATERSRDDEVGTPATDQHPERVAVETPGGERLVLLRGCVLDAYGEPIAGAMVGAADSASPVRTAGDGRFVLSASPGAAIAMLTLATGHAPSVTRVTVRAEAGEQDLGDLQLALGGGLRGLVTDAAGNGVAGALVTPQLLTSPWLPEGFDAALLLAPVHTDAGGSYAFSHQVAGTYRLAVTAAGMQAASSVDLVVRDSEDTVAEPIVVAVGHELTGVVVDARAQPIAGANLRLRGRLQRYRGVAVSDAEGRFAFAGLPPGPMDLVVDRDGYQQFERSIPDVSKEPELVVRLSDGLSIRGFVVDARDGSPVERFAVVCRRIGEVAPVSNGSMAQQLERQLQELRAASAPEHLISQLQERQRDVAEVVQARALVVPDGLGEVQERPGGALQIDGLEAGAYAVGVLSPEHQYAEITPVVVAPDTPFQALRFELRAGLSVTGTVTGKIDQRPRGDVIVQLLRVFERAEANAAAAPRQPLYPWFFAAPGPTGIALMSTRTDAAGTFAFRNVAPGRYFVTLRAASIADQDSAPFELHSGMQQLQLAVGDRASLRGRITNVPSGQRSGCSVLVLGGHGILRTVAAAADGSYRCDDLQPGGYLVRAFPADATQYQRRLLAEVFPAHAGAVDRDKVTPCDVMLAEDELRVLDLTLDVPATGRALGTVLVNDAPAERTLVLLRPVPGEAPGSGGLSLRGDCDAQGSFQIADVPAGNYTLVVLSNARQELHREAVTVAPGAPSIVTANVTSGGLRGCVLVADNTPVTELRGYVWVLPGAEAEPDDLYAFRREHRTHRLLVRDGAFEEQALTPGPALVILDLRGRARHSELLTLPARTVLQHDLPAGPRR